VQQFGTLITPAYKNTKFVNASNGSQSAGFCYISPTITNNITQGSTKKC